MVNDALGVMMGITTVVAELRRITVRLFLGQRLRTGIILSKENYALIAKNGIDPNSRFGNRRNEL